MKENMNLKNFLFSAFYSQPGFTLVEVLIASVVMSVGLLIVIGAMGRSQQAMQVAENMVIASQLAENKIVQTEVGVREFSKLSSGRESGEDKLPGKIFAWQKEIQPYKHETILDETKLNQVSVALEWKEGARRGGLALESLILNREKVSQ